MNESYYIAEKFDFDVFYETEVITSNQIVLSKECNAISFEHLGDEESIVHILKDIPVTPEKIREFCNEPGRIIKSKFPIIFTGSGTQKILVVRTYYRENNVKN